jgi:hypothetical protein
MLVFGVGVRGGGVWWRRLLTTRPLRGCAVSVATLGGYSAALCRRTERGGQRRSATCFGPWAKLQLTVLAIVEAAISAFLVFKVMLWYWSVGGITD